MPSSGTEKLSLDLTVVVLAPLAGTLSLGQIGWLWSM